MSAARRRWLLATICALGLALHLPSLGWGFWVDDYVHQLVLAGDERAGAMRPIGLYDFGERAAWVTEDDGVSAFPWWTSPDWRIRFFRPLSSLSLMLDHALYGARPLPYHLTSLALWLAVLLAAHGLYRALGLGDGAALLATALLACADSATIPVGWIANRNTLLAVLFGVLALRAVAAPGALARPGRVALALALAWCAALSKESGLAAFAVLVARAWLARRRGEPGAHARALLVLAAASALAHAAFLVAAGYGSRAIFYPVPWREPVRFAARLAAVLFAGGASLAAPVPVDAVAMYPRLAWPLAAVCALAVVPFARALWRRVGDHGAAPLLALWVLVALLPQSLAPPAERLLLEACVGAAPLLALLVVRARAAGRADGRGRRLSTLVLASAGAASALSTLATGASLGALSNEVRRTVVEADVGPQSLGRRIVLLLQCHNALVPFGMASTWSVESDDRDLEFHVLQMGRRGLALERTGEAAFELTALGEPFLTNAFESVYLTTSRPPPVGTRFEAGRFDVEVLEVAPRGPRRLRFELDRSLDDPSLRLLAWNGERLAPVAPPPVGETLELPAIVPPHPMVP